MFAKTLLSAAVAATALTSLSAAAQDLQFGPNAQDACNPEAWDQFGFAVENRDYDLLATMFNDAEYKVCEFYATVEVLFCEENPLACITPAGGPDPDDDPRDDPNDDPNDDPQDDPQDEPEDPLGGDTRPGENIGNEGNDSGDDGNDGGDDGGDDGNEPSGGDEPGGNDTGRDPTGGPNDNSIG